MSKQDIISSIMQDASICFYPHLGVIKFYPHTLQHILADHIPEEPPQATVTVKGGLVRDVSHTPGVEVIVRDYDCDGATVPLKTDDEGHEYVETTW